MADSIDLVVVSSDDAEILRLARDYGAEAVQRPAELATDEARTEPAIRHAVEVLSLSDDLSYVGLAQCTTPFLDPQHVERCFRTLEGDTRAQIAILAAVGHTVYWRETRGRDYCRGCISHAHGLIRGRRQDDEHDTLLETGGFYLYRWSWFAWYGDRVMPEHTRLVRIPYWPYSLQIDDQADLEAARSLLHLTEPAPV